MSKRVLAAVFLAAAALPSTALAAPSSSPPTLANRPVCPGPSAGTAECHARIVTDAHGAPLTGAAPAPGSYGPADLTSAYGLAGLTGSTTIAIVDAYDAPTAQNDLNVYRAQYKLPACGPGCFTKVNQDGGTTPPRANGGWAQEISLDLDMASAICPGCKILLVEANSSAYTDLGAAVNTAARLGATVISNSYGGNEFSQEVNSPYAGYYNHPGIAITVSSGDSGYGTEFPAASPYVTAVGGTTLRRAAGTSRGWTETAWSGAGSGCSAYVARPSWQAGACAKRAVADVSAVADPNTGVAVYDSYRYKGASGWMVFGGTSVAAPVIAGVYALAGNAATVSYANSLPYSNAGALNDVVSGSNGSCSLAYLCNAGPGFDGPTGLGTPNGIGAF